MKNKEILEKLAKRTVEYFNVELGLEVDQNYKIDKIDKINYSDITTLITLSSDISGTIGMSVSNEFAHQMIKNFIHVDLSEKEILELSSENVAETLNITLGNILKELTVIKKGGNVDISTPYTMHNAVSITKKTDGIMYLCKLQAQNEIIYLSYFL